MALLVIKQLLFPSSGRTRYAPIPPSSPASLDIEHDAMSEDSFNEKTFERLDQPLPVRINPRIISDATIGLSDGLTVPFALTAGLSALGDTNVVIYGGLAELIAGGISMGLGGYLGAKGEAEAYHAALTETRVIVDEDQDKAVAMFRSTFSSYDFSEQTLGCMVASLLAEPAQMVDFLMRFHHQLTEADHAPSRAYTCGLTIAFGYFFGGLAPLVPYFFVSDIQQAFFGSVVFMVMALFLFGWAKTSLVGETCRWTCFRNGLQMVMLGGVAAGAAMGCVKAVGS